MSLAVYNHLCNFGRGHYGEHSCEIILNLDQLFGRCLLEFTDDRLTGHARGEGAGGGGGGGGVLPIFLHT